MKVLVSLIIPCYNEEEALPFLYDELCKVTKDIREYDFEFVFVDDGSKDKTIDVIKNCVKADERVKFVRFARNFGKEAAMYAGFCNAKGEYVAVMDADMQDPPSLLPEMLKILGSGEFDSVATCRVTRSGEPALRSFFARMFYRIINRISDADIKDGARDFRLMKRSMVDVIVKMQEHSRFSKGIYGWIGFRTYWLPYENIERVAGKTKWSFGKLFKYSLQGIVDFSDMPLKLSVYGGLLLMFVSVIISFISFIYVGFTDKIWVITALMVFLCGIQMLSLGVMGMYIGKIYFETKKRPQYTIMESNIRE